MRPNQLCALWAAILVGAFFLSPGQVAAADQCGAGWTLSNGKCYTALISAKLNLAPGMTFDEARFQCEQEALAKGMHAGNLASVHSDEENKLLNKLMMASGASVYNYWFGMFLKRGEQTPAPEWPVKVAYWTDHSPVDFGDPATGSKRAPWESTQPDNDKVHFEFCAAARAAGGVWHDYPCHHSMEAAACQALPGPHY